MIDHFYTIEMSAQGCEAELYINDLPFARRGPPPLGEEVGGPVHPYLIDGVNELALVMRPGARPATALSGDGARRSWVGEAGQAKAILARYPYGSTLGSPDAVELAAVTWCATQDEPARPFPCVAATRFDLGAMFGPWAWQQADELVLDETLEAEARAVLEPLAEAMAAGRLVPWIDALSLVFEEAGRCYEELGEAMAAKSLKLIELDRRERGWTLEPANWDALELRLCGHNRLIECLARDGKPILRSTSDRPETVNFFPALLGRVDGALRILR